MLQQCRATACTEESWPRNDAKKEFARIVTSLP